jgi:hypothetical protein
MRDSSGSGKEISPEDFERKGDEARGGKDEKIMDLPLQTKQQNTSRTLSLPCYNSLYSHQEEIP